MAFPSLPANNQTAVINGITYAYNSSTNAWTRIPSQINFQYITDQANAGLILAGAAYASGNAAVLNTNAYITANAASTNAYTNSVVSSNVATINGYITSNAASTNAYTNSVVSTIGASANAYTNSVVSSNVSAINSSIEANASMVIGFTNSAIASNIATVNGYIASNVAAINSSIQSNAAAIISTTNSAIASNIALVNSSIEANASMVIGFTNAAIASNVATVNSSIEANAAMVIGFTNSAIASNVSALNSSITSNATYLYSHANAAYTVANNALLRTGGTVSGSITIEQDLNVTGNIFLAGNTATITTNNIVVDDSIIFIANNNPSNILDIGIVGKLNAGYNQHTGIVKDATDGKWKLFSNVVTTPTQTILFDATTIYDTLKLGTIEATTANISGVDLLGYASSAYAQGNTTILNTNSYISSNVATVRSEILSNVSNINSSISANAASTNAYTHNIISSNVAAVNASIEANASMVIGFTNSAIASNVSAINGYITSNAASTNAYTHGIISSNVAAVNASIEANASMVIGFTNAAIASNIAPVLSTAQAAYDAANTDFTYLTSSAASYGNSYSTNIINLASNGRIISITTELLRTATATQNGVVYLDDGVANSTPASGNTAATPLAVKTAYEHANAAFYAANNAGSSGLAYDKANAAFNYANTVFLHANAAFNLANTGGGGGGTSVYIYTDLDAVTDPFTGDGTTTIFTLSELDVDINKTTVNIDGVLQLKTAYSIVGGTLTFSGPPADGAAIEVNIFKSGTIAVDSQAAYDKANTAANTANNAASTGKAIAMAIVFGF